MVISSLSYRRRRNDPQEKEENEENEEKEEKEAAQGCGNGLRDCIHVLFGVAERRAARSAARSDVVGAGLASRWTPDR